jgi:protein TonB
MPKPRKSGSARLINPRLILPSIPDGSKDRLSSTLFLAGLLHGVILLGVTFTADGLPPEATTSLEVVLITNEYEKLLAPEDAELLAQQNMVGAGNTEDAMLLKTALNQIFESGPVGPEQIGVPDPRRRGQEEPQPRPTIVAKSALNPNRIPEFHADEAHITEQQQRTLPGVANAIEIIDEPDAETLITDFRPRELVISANTREARMAAYLGRWKNKIERVGTLNYPDIARAKGLAGFPTLEVAINSRGQLEEVILRSSSGERALDKAAMRIVKMASPFDPFPEFLRTEYEVLRFAYEWRFTEGQLSTTVSNVSAY